MFRTVLSSRIVKFIIREEKPGVDVLWIYRRKGSAKMEAAGSSETIITIHHIRRRHVPEDCYLHSHCGGNDAFQIVF
jgi:hypothetical protein